MKPRKKAELRRWDGASPDRIVVRGTICRMNLLVKIDLGGNGVS